MAEPAVSEVRHILDPGIESGLAAVPEDTIQVAVNSVLKGEAGARLKVYMETCIHCGMCSMACHYYKSYQSPEYTPAGKVKQTIWKMLKKNGKVSKEFIRQAAVIAHTECNLCKRCAHFCPFGVDIAYLMTLVRRIIHKLGCTPQYIQATAHSHSVHMNQMWVKGDEWPDTLQWQEEEAQEEIPTLRIPLEKKGADIMYSVIAPEPKFQAQLIYKAAVIFHTAGLNWTMPATTGWDNSDMAMYTGDNEIMTRIKREHFETAARLKVKKIVMGECGHAFRSIYDMGNRVLGWKMPPIPVIHAIDFFHHLIKTGKIKIANKLPVKATLHDPCNVIRGNGLFEKSRYIANALCEEVVEMSPNGEHNYCCAAGGGVINCGPLYKEKRVKGNRIKADQLADAKDKGATVLIAPCHNCHSGLEDINHYYKLGLDIKFFGDIIYEIMEKPKFIQRGVK